MESLLSFETRNSRVTGWLLADGSLGLASMETVVLCQWGSEARVGKGSIAGLACIVASIVIGVMGIV